MKTLTSPSVASLPEDWIDHCAFTSRHQTLERRPASLIQKFEDAASPPQAWPEPVIFPRIERARQPVKKSLAPAKKQLPDLVRAELHSFRQLSSPFFCPETSRDTLPEYILFGLIVLLAVAWPILAMLGVMARN